MIILYKPGKVRFTNVQSVLIKQKECKESLKFEAYLNALPSSLSKVMCKFRCSDHKLPVEQGRLCTLCIFNQVGDEYHYIFQCSSFSAVRHKYLSTCRQQAVSTYKYAFLMNSTDTTVPIMLALILKSVMSKFQKYFQYVILSLMSLTRLFK